MNEHAFAAILDGGEPPRLQRDVRAFHVGFVLAVDIRHHGFQSGEPDESQHLAQPVKLHDRCDSGTAVSLAPRGVGQPARVEIGVDGHVVPESFGRPEQRFQLDLLDRPLAAVAAPDRADGLENLVGLK